MGRLALFALVLGGCGRLGFDSNLAAGSGDGQPDAAEVFVPPNDAPITEPVANLFASWSFEDGGGTSTMDSSGGVVATCIGANCPTTTQGIVGTALQFNGTTSCLDVASFASWNPTAFTVSAWVKGNAMSGPIIAHESFNGCPSPEVAIKNGLGIIQLNTTNNLPHNEVWTAAITSPSTWHHIAVSWDGSAQSLYLDGVCQCRLPQAKGPSITSQPFSLGCYPQAAPQEFFNGAIDELRLYDRALANTEIAQLYASVTQVVPTMQACSTTCPTSAP